MEVDPAAEARIDRQIGWARASASRVTTKLQVRGKQRVRSGRGLVGLAEPL